MIVTPVGKTMGGVNHFKWPICEEEQLNDVVDDGFSDWSTHLENDDSIRHDSPSVASDFVETLIIFDFDDTLFPTSWLQHGFRSESLLNEHHTEQLKILAERVLQVLHMALRLGRVVIVTNGLEGWVEMCCEEDMPSLMQIFAKVDIVSARSKYENKSPDPSEWKRLAFQHEAELLEFAGATCATQYNVIALGDSLHEQFAVKSLTEEKANYYGKFVKFLKAPTIDQLIAQHEFVASNLSDIVEHPGHLEVGIAL
jgi:hypothetical protein